MKMRSKTDTLEFECVNGHIIVPVGNYRALVDSGSPFSIAPCPFELFGRQHSPPDSMMGITPKRMSELSGFQIDILIGCDILSQQDIRIRWSEKKFDWSVGIPENPLTMKLDTLMGIPIFPITIRDAPTKAILDTGAHLSYIDPDIVRGEDPINQRDDFSPFIGHFTASTYQIPIKLDTSPMSIEFGILPEALQAMTGMAFAMSNASAVIGTQLLERYNCTLLWNKGIISWQRNEYDKGLS